MPKTEFRCKSYGQNKIGGQKWGPSEKFSLAKITHFAKLAKLAMSNIEMFAKCLRISLGFSLQQKFSLATVFSEIWHFRYSQNFR